MKYAEKYKTGMIFRSKRYPWADLIIDDVCYSRAAQSADHFNQLSFVCWHRINDVEFDMYICKSKGYNYRPDKNGRMDFSDKTIYPFSFCGELKPKSMDTYIRKYELECVEMSDKEVVIYCDDDIEYYSVFKG